MKNKIVAIFLVIMVVFTVTTANTPVTVLASRVEQVSKVKECLTNLNIYKESLIEESDNIGQKINLLQTIVMVVRLNGAEDIALTGVYSGEYPYTDVPKWADDYIGYAYTMSMLKDIKGNKLNGEKNVTASQFLDVLLVGALEYTDVKDSVSTAKKIGLLDGNINTKVFTLKDALLICYNALEVKVNDNYNKYTLTQRNINDFKVYTLNQYNKQKKITDKFIENDIKIEKEKQAQKKKQEEAKKAEQKRKEDEAKSKIPQKSIDIVKSYKPYYVDSGTKEKIAYLTFDDGPNNVVTPVVLDTLKKYNVKATFFLVGQYVDANPKMVKRIYDEGHTLANHSYTHDYGKVYSSTKSFANEINKTQRSINKALGFNYNNHIFRFPGGSHNKSNIFKQEVYNLGYQFYDWNAAGEDAMSARRVSSYEVLNSTIKTSKGKNELTLLYHDAATKSTTAEALPQIIKYLKKQGYAFKTLDEAPANKIKK